MLRKFNFSNLKSFINVRNMTIKNVLLIGFPGTGKTTIGKKLAKKINFEFFDTDSMIEKKYSMPLNFVINRYNLEFKIIEKNMLYLVIKYNQTLYD